MPSVLKISEAASMAMHTMVILAASGGGTISAKEIAARLNASEAHLAKVMQRLARAGLVKSTRGPKGGFVLSRRGEEITLLEVYQSIEGPLPEDGCLFEQPSCHGNGCILGGFLDQVNRDLRIYLETTTVSGQNNLYRRDENGKEIDRTHR
ncbi:MAG: Rrf2 family transcriptional regulator [bacterium]|nr:MAG: Rrf2 family transcriptional regulator [bacterium]